MSSSEYKPGVGDYVCNPDTQEAEAGLSWIQGKYSDPISNQKVNIMHRNLRAYPYNEP